MEGLAPHRVLVVDDNQEAANLVAKLLRLLGQTAMPAYDGPSALHFASEFKPDIVFLDLVMPNMDGFTVARRLRELHGLNPPKIVALTAFGQPAFLEAALAAGFDGHITKPASAEELAKALSI